MTPASLLASENGPFLFFFQGALLCLCPLPLCYGSFCSIGAGWGGFCQIRQLPWRPEFRFPWKPAEGSASRAVGDGAGGSR